MILGPTRLFVLAAGAALGVCAEPNRSWEALMQSLQPGRTVVVTRMNSAIVEGKLLALGTDSITVRWHGNTEIVQKEDVFRVRIANIRRRHTLLGMAIGAGAGAIIGAAGSNSYNRSTGTAGGAVLGVAFGALGGGVAPIGAPLYEAPKPVKRPKPPAEPPRRE